MTGEYGCIYDMGMMYDILKHIMDNGECKASDFEDLACWRTIQARLDKLSDEGLIEFYIRTKGRRVKCYRLTRKGYEIVVLMRIGSMIHSGGLGDKTGYVSRTVNELVEELNINEYSHSLDMS